nr:hypothetical protein [Tanacetum cinerariifolium]
MARTTSSSTNIEVQIIELLRKEVDNDLKLEKKFRELCLEVIDIDELEKLIGDPAAADPVAAEAMCMLKRVQSRDMEKATHLQIMVVGSHLSAREKHLVNLGILVDWQHDPYHGDNEAEETKKLFSELDQLLEHVSFLNDKLSETVVGFDALLIALEEVLERVENMDDDEIERIRNMKERTKMRVHLEMFSLKNQTRGKG